MTKDRKIIKKQNKEIQNLYMQMYEYKYRNGDNNGQENKRYSRETDNWMDGQT